MANFTVTYSQKAKGFPSFYSFVPESMIGMNNRFFSFKNGELYLHNSDEVARNNFYEENGSSSIELVVNDKPFDNKIFKTVNLEGTHPWDVTLVSDIQNTGNIDADWFEEKEGSFRAFMRNTGGDPIGTADLPLRSMNGIGRASSVAVATTIGSAFFPMDNRLSGLNIGDMIYYSEDVDSYATVKPFGECVAISTNSGNTQRFVTIQMVSPAPVITDSNPLILNAKNAIAESHGVLGHHGTFTLTNATSQPVELIALETEVMISKA